MRSKCAKARARRAVANTSVGSERRTEVVGDGGMNEPMDSLQETSLDQGKGKGRGEEPWCFQQ